MAWGTRIRSAARAALLHFGLSLLVACAAAWLVFRVWYPAPFHELTGGRSLFLILIVVDVVCGPVLTLVLYDPSKSRFKWRIDMALIVLTQLGALAYGLNQVAGARPVFVAFEGDRFRVVQAMDVDATRMPDAPEGLRMLGFGGPRLLGVRLAQPSDADYLQSVQWSLQGLHPSFRPSRWRSFEEQVPAVQKALRPITELRNKHPDRHAELNARLAELGLSEDQAGYLPLVREETTDWVALVDRADGQPRAYLHLDGW
ncbi:MAG: TfpX/TfpZ family type IV pilin accessory protein [Hydrogenophaga sp.]|uniref:TfpX/TfpZ family type IV pilin accessory protein n=1 Tax=Hydrogenophaga sp. TaxID=1904254 RepID=UPI003D0B1293